MAFINPPRTTTPSPAEQQAIEEQRRFQEEIANKGLREQEQRSFGLPQPPTTRPTTTSTTTQNPFDPSLLQLEPFANTESNADFEQSTENFLFNNGRVHQPLAPQPVLPHFQPVLPQVPQSHSYSYSRIFRSLNRKSRSIDRQQLSVNLLPSTTAPHQFYYHEKRQTTPKNEYGSIGSWLISHFSQQLQQSIASLSQTAATPYSPRTVKSPHPNPQNYRRPSYTERPYYTTPNHRPTASQLWPRYPESGFRPTTPQPWHGHVIPSTEAALTSSPRPFQYAGSGNKEAPYWNTPLRFQIPQYPQTETEPSVTNEVANYIPSGVIQTTSIPQTAGVSFKPLPASYMVQPHLPLIPHSIPTYSPYSTTPASIDDNTKPLRVKNVQILTSSPVPFQFDGLPAQPQNEKAVYQAYNQAYRQIFAADHQSFRPTESAVQSSITQSSEENTSVTSLFKSKLNEFKSFHPSQAAALEDAQSKFQQPNQFLDQLQQQPQANSDQFRSTSSTNSADPADLTSGFGNEAGKTAIFIRVPTEEPTSTVGYVFDKAISAKTLQKKENLTGHKKNYRSAQVIKSSLVYRTPPGKRATVSREEQLLNNQVTNSEAGAPIKWLLGNAASTTTKRPFVSALLNLIQKRSPQ